MSPAYPASPSAECLEIREVLNRIGDKWSLQVVGILGDGPRRFNDLRRNIDGISQRMLTLTLRLLVQFNAKTLPPDEEALLPGATGSFLSQNYPNPTPRAAADSNQRVIDLLDNIRIQLTRPNGLNP